MLKKIWNSIKTFFVLIAGAFDDLAKSGVPERESKPTWNDIYLKVGEKPCKHVAAWKGRIIIVDTDLNKTQRYIYDTEKGKLVLESEYSGVPEYSSLLD